MILPFFLLLQKKSVLSLSVHQPGTDRSGLRVQDGSTYT